MADAERSAPGRLTGNAKPGPPPSGEEPGSLLQLVPWHLHYTAGTIHRQLMLRSRWCSVRSPTACSVINVPQCAVASGAEIGLGGLRQRSLAARTWTQQGWRPVPKHAGVRLVTREVDRQDEDHRMGIPHRPSRVGVVELVIDAPGSADLVVDGSGETLGDRTAGFTPEYPSAVDSCRVTRVCAT